MLSHNLFFLSFLWSSHYVPSSLDGPLNTLKHIDTGHVTQSENTSISLVAEQRI